MKYGVKHLTIARSLLRRGSTGIEWKRRESKRGDQLDYNLFFLIVKKIPEQASEGRRLTLLNVI